MEGVFGDAGASTLCRPLLDGEGMSEVCRDFGISRKTGYKIFNRYRDQGLEALTDRSRRPVRYANQLPDQVERLIVDLKRDKPHWGARKIRELLVRKLAGDGACRPGAPCMRCSTATAWSTAPEFWAQPRQRHAAVGRRQSQRPVVRRLQGRVQARQWPLLLPPDGLRPCGAYLLLCEAFKSTREAPVIAAFQRLFRDRGLPVAIRSDNGLPFASPNGLYNLSRLSVWWLRLGIAIERIKPGHPQQNGRHERMHLTLKKEATRPPGLNSLQQQARFDAFVREFNAERPHEALAMRCPAEFYTASPRPYDGLPELQYPWHDRDILVTACGRICMHRKKINISTVLAGQKLGIREVDDGIWLVSFMHYDLGYIDLEQRTLQTIDNPFGTRLSPMS